MKKKWKKYEIESRIKFSAIRQGIKLKDWKGFIGREPYSQNWDLNFKNSIRKRDNQVCMLCSTPRERLKQELSIHHIDYNKLNTIPKNCISLCRRCHTITNANRSYWTTFFQSLLSNRYGYNYSQPQVINFEVIPNAK
jgi:hypothetical protein